MKTNNLILLAVLMLASLFSVHAQEQTVDTKKAILGKWQFSEMKVEVLTSDLAVTAQFEGMFVVLNQLLLDREKTQKEVEFTEDGHILNAGTFYFSYSVLGNKLITSRDGKTEEQNFIIKNDSLICSSDVPEKFYDLIDLMSYSDENLDNKEIEPKSPKDLIIEKCAVAVYLVRPTEDADIE